MLPGFTDSRYFRAAFPDCVAYGFFPQRHMSCFDSSPLIHGADERIDVRDLELRGRVLPRPRPGAARMSATTEPEKLRLGGMALRNGLLVHGPTHWAAAVRAPGRRRSAASGGKPRVRAFDGVRARAEWRGSPRRWR